MATKDRREFVGLRLLPESVADARRVAAEEGSDLSTVLRRWMGLGRAAEQAHWKPPSVARTAGTPAPDPDTPRQARTSPKSEAGRRRDRT
jgi:hypothetical protein